MVEPFTAAIISRQSILKLPLNAMTRHPFPTDFFSPLSRQYKGKERAVESPFVECSHCSLASSTSYTSRHSPWCPIRNRLFMMNHVIPRRSQPLFHPPSCGRRHSSSVAHTISPQKPSFDWSQSISFPVDKLRSLFTSGTPFDPERAWHLYIQSMQAGATFTTAEQFQLIKSLLGAFDLQGDTVPDLKLLHIWGTRLEPILQGLSSKSDEDFPELFSLKCFHAQVNAWLGDVVRASRLARELQNPSTSKDEERTLLHVYQNILVLLHARRGPLHALDLLLREEVFFSPLLPRAPSFHKVVHKLLADIADGANLLRSRLNADRHCRSRLGRLLLGAYCAEKLLHQAHALVLEMRRQQLHIDFHLQARLIKLLAQRNLFVLAHEIFPSVEHPTNPRLYYRTGLFLYARCGDVNRAEQFFAKHDKNTWSISFARSMLMHAYAVAGKADTVVELFHKFFPATPGGDFLAERPGVVHYTAVILAHAELTNVDGIHLWVEKMRQAGCPPDGHVYNVVLHYFATHGDVDSVAATLDQMRAAEVKPDRVHYTTIVTLFAKRKHVAAAEAIYLRALRDGIVPDRIMITSLMNAHAEAGSWDGVVRIFDHLRRSPRPRHDLSIEVYNTLLKAYILSGTPFRVVSMIFFKLARLGVCPDRYTYAWIIQSACDAGKMDVAEELFTEMEKKAKSWGPLYRLDAYVLTIIMAGHIRQGSKARAKACYEDMQRRGIKASSITYKQIIQAFANDRTGESLEIAELFLRQIMDADTSDPSWLGTESRPSALGNIYSPLMQAYAKRERPEEVIRLFNGMLEAGGEPSMASLTIVLDVHRRTYNIDIVRQLWPQIWTLALRHSRADVLFKEDDKTSTFAIGRRSSLLCIPLSIYIDALSVAGDHNMVLDTWTMAKTEGFGFDAHNWNHLAVALVRAGELDRAFEVLERVLVPHLRKDTCTGNRYPESPLAFDVVAPDVDMPASDIPLRQNARRAKAVKFATKTIGSLLAVPEDSTDFAHPLHILHQVTPGLPMWRPHAVTLQVLSKALGHLQRGRLVQPIRASGAPSATPQGQMDSQSQVEIANATLRRIYRNYPGAVRAVLLYQRGQAQREATQQSARKWVKVKQHVVDTLADEDTAGSHEQ